MNHLQSFKLENKLYIAAKVKMEEMQQHGMSWIEAQLLINGVDVLSSCRLMLMHCYSFAYYLQKNNQVLIFEDNQRDLEEATEQLSNYLEREITHDSISSIKQNVQDKTRYCEKRRQALISHIKEGYNSGIWKFETELL